MPSSSHASAGSLADLAARLAEARSLPETCSVAVGVAHDLLPTVDHVSVTLVDGEEGWTSPAATDALAARLQRLQHELRQGPCVDVLAEPALALVELKGARHDPRWHDYVPRALRLGLRSQVAVALSLGRRVIGALDLYSTSSYVLDERTRELAPLLAAPLTLAIAHSRQVDNLTRALESRTIIGQAVGITMRQYGIGSDAAFKFLVRRSAESQRKLREVAADVVAEVEAAITPDAVRVDPSS